MQFIDRATIEVQAGDGGDGMVAFRREKFVPAGGPAGGNGGRGGSIQLVADSGLQTLLDFQFQRLYRAECGSKGGPSNKTGRRGGDRQIRVPCGTVVVDADTEELIGDLVTHGQVLEVATGGSGGLGNAHFLSNRNRAPEKMTPGKPGQHRRLYLELKLIAQIGLVGLPNAGKSTLIAALSSARPKVADYPFTTLVPNLGVIRRPMGDGIVIADIPGLIAGAHTGVGLGHEFLRHVERTRLLVHVIDGTQLDPVEAYHVIQSELQAYHDTLGVKPQVVVLNKIDAIPADLIAEIQQLLSTAAQAVVLPISAVTGSGCDRLLHHLFQMLETVLPIQTPDRQLTSQQADIGHPELAPP